MQQHSYTTCNHDLQPNKLSVAHIYRTLILRTGSDVQLDRCVHIRPDVTYSSQRVYVQHYFHRHIGIVTYISVLIWSLSMFRPNYLFIHTPAYFTNTQSMHIVLLLFRVKSSGNGFSLIHSVYICMQWWAFCWLYAEVNEIDFRYQRHHQCTKRHPLRWCYSSLATSAVSVLQRQWNEKIERIYIISHMISNATILKMVNFFFLGCMVYSFWIECFLSTSGNRCCIFWAKLIIEKWF